MASAPKPSFPPSGTAQAVLKPDPQVKAGVKKPYPMFLGGIAAAIAGSCTHPLDLVKCRMQVTGDKSMADSFKRVVGTNGVRGLYDGLTGTLLRQMTYSLGRFAIYEDVKTRLHSGPGPVPVSTLMIAGSVAGGLAGAACNPAEQIMVRMQADRGKAPELRYNYKNSVQGLSRMLREEGFGAMYRGVAPNTARALLMNAGQLGGYDLFKGLILKSKVLEDGPVTHFASGFCAATLAIIMCQPADLISRMMASAGKAGVFDVIKASVAKEGLFVFYKGVIPAWIRLQPTTILTFLVLEQLRGGVDVLRAGGSTWI